MKLMRNRNSIANSVVYSFYCYNAAFEVRFEAFVSARVSADLDGSDNADSGDE